MQTYHYFLGLFALAVVGFVLAMYQDMKSTTRPSTRKWGYWMIAMALIMIGDIAAMLAFVPK